MIYTASGSLNDFTANVEIDNDNFENAKFNFSAKIDSINTKNNHRNTHLKSEDFFTRQNTPNYPLMAIQWWEI